MHRVSNSVGRQLADDELIGALRPYGKKIITFEQVLEAGEEIDLDTDATEALYREMVKGGRLTLVSPGRVRVSFEEHEETELGRFRREYMEWLEQQPAWSRMPHNQRALHAYRVKKFLWPDGITVNPKELRKHYLRAYRLEMTVVAFETAYNRMNRFLEREGLQVSVPDWRENGSQKSSTRFPAAAAYIHMGRPVPNALAEHLGWATVTPLGKVVKLAAGGGR